jgi:hypothetical protein
MRARPGAIVTADEELDEARARIADLGAELENAHGEQLADAQRRAITYADELLTCAITIAGLGESALDELDIALGIVRRRAEEHGILRPRLPRVVS